MEKQEAIKKIEQINSILVDKEKITPISGMIFIGWGIAIVILTYLIPWIFFNETFEVTQKLEYSFISFIIVFGITFAFEYLFVKKENIKAGFNQFTKLQKDIEKNCFLAVAIGVVLTLALGLTGGWFFIFSVWFFLIGFAYYVTGVMFKRIYKIYGLILLAVGFGLSFYGIALISQNIMLPWSEKNLIFNHIFIVGKYLSISFLGVGHIIVGFLTQRGKKIV